MQIGGKAWMVNTQVLVGLYQLLRPPLKNFWVSPRQVPCLTSEIISWEWVVGT